MALKVKAQEKLQKIGTHAGKYRYIMMPELYTLLSQERKRGISNATIHKFEDMESLSEFLIAM